MNRIALFALPLVLLVVLASADEIHVKPGTYDNIPANPGDDVLFEPGVCILLIRFIFFFY